MKPNKQVIKELETERDEIMAKNKVAGQMIYNGIDHEQNLLLSMQMSAYKTVTHVLNARIRLLEKQVPVVEEPKKFNVQVPGIKDRFYYQCNVENGDILSIFGAAGNRDSNQQFTLEKIEKFKLQDCPRFEVSEVKDRFYFSASDGTGRTYHTN